MKDLKYKIALVAYYGPLTIGAILASFYIAHNTLRFNQLQTEIQPLRQSIIKELEEIK